MRDKRLGNGLGKDVPSRMARVTLFVAACLAVSTTACAGRKKNTVAVTASTYTYEEAHSLVYLNDHWAGSGSNNVVLGDASGGGGICCVRLKRGAKTARVKIEYGLTEVFEVDAPIEQPWPEYPHYLAIHILPGRKVVIELSTLWTSPRSDLLTARLKEIGKWPVEIQAPHAWHAGPELPVKREKADD